MLEMGDSPNHPLSANARFQNGKRSGRENTGIDEGSAAGTVSREVVTLCVPCVPDLKTVMYLSEPVP